MKYFLVIATLISNVIVAADFTIHLEHVEKLSSMLNALDQNNPYHQSLTNAVEHYLKNSDAENAISCWALNNACTATRKAGTYVPNGFYSTTTYEDKLVVVNSFHESKGYSLDERNNFLTLNDEKRSRALDSYRNNLSIYQKNFELPFRLIVLKVLKIMDDWQAPSTEHRNQVLTLLKSSGVLSISVEDVTKFTYDATEEIINYLEANPHVDTMIFGCGHFIPNDELLPLFIGNAMQGCRMCPHATHHEGQLTVDMDGSENADIVANVKAIDWKRLPANRLQHIVDESWANLIDDKTHSELKHILKSKGTIAKRDYIDSTPSDEILFTNLPN